MTTQRMICELHYQVNVSSTENITSYAINKGTLYFWEEEIITRDKRDLLLLVQQGSNLIVHFMVKARNFAQ